MNNFLSRMNPFLAARRLGARRPRIVTRCTSRSVVDGSPAVARVTILENHTLQDAVRFLARRARWTPAWYDLLDLYRIERTFPDMSHFRLGPNMFEKILLDWILFVDEAGRDLIGHGITTRIDWDQNPEHLPGGWQDAVRHSYRHSNVDLRPANTLVGLFILVQNRCRRHGWANNIIQEMRSLGQRRNVLSLIIPLRPPLRYEKEYAELPMDAFASLKREDGQPLDHWIRLHTRLGAKIIGTSNASHQHAFALKDFYEQVPTPEITRTGYALVQHRDGGWYRVYVDLEHQFVLINQGCVWVQHPLTGPTSTAPAEPAAGRAHTGKETER